MEIVKDKTYTEEVSYNKFGEPVKKAVNGTAQSYEYDIEGNVTKHIITDKDTNDIVTEYVYDNMNRLVSTVTPMGAEYLTYDKAGRITQKENTAQGTIILYREMMCFNVTDALGDNIGDDTSRGLGQIKPSTAIAAETEYNSQNPGVINVHTENQIKTRLSNEKTNIYYVGMVLWHCAKQTNVWIDLDYAYDSCVNVLARYNGTGDAAQRYGRETSDYLDPFIKYYGR